MDNKEQQVLETQSIGQKRNRDNDDNDLLHAKRHKSEGLTKKTKLKQIELDVKHILSDMKIVNSVNRDCIYAFVRNYLRTKLRAKYNIDVNRNLSYIVDGDNISNFRIDLVVDDMFGITIKGDEISDHEYNIMEGFTVYITRTGFQIRPVTVIPNGEIQVDDSVLQKVEEYAASIQHGDFKNEMAQEIYQFVIATAIYVEEIYGVSHGEHYLRSKMIDILKTKYDVEVEKNIQSLNTDVISTQEKKRMDLVINGIFVVELKAGNCTSIYSKKSKQDNPKYNTYPVGNISQLLFYMKVDNYAYGALVKFNQELFATPVFAPQQSSNLFEEIQKHAGFKRSFIHHFVDRSKSLPLSKPQEQNESA